MFSVNQRFKNTSKTRKPQWYVCKVLIGLSCTIYSGSSLADTNHGQMAVSLAVIGGATAVNTGRNFGSSHYTWGAAEISLLKAGYKKPTRIGTINEIYWFTVPVSGNPTVIGVSVISGEIKHTYQTAN